MNKEELKKRWEELCIEHKQYHESFEPGINNMMFDAAIHDLLMQYLDFPKKPSLGVKKMNYKGTYITEKELLVLLEYRDISIKDLREQVRRLRDILYDNEIEYLQ